MEDLKKARLKCDLSQKAAAGMFQIPVRTWQNWETSLRGCPPYLEQMLIEKLENYYAEQTESPVKILDNFAKAWEKLEEITSKDGLMVGYPFDQPINKKTAEVREWVRKSKNNLR